MKRNKKLVLIAMTGFPVMFSAVELGLYVTIGTTVGDWTEDRTLAAFLYAMAWIFCSGVVYLVVNTDD